MNSLFQGNEERLHPEAPRVSTTMEPSSGSKSAATTVDEIRGGASERY